MFQIRNENRKSYLSHIVEKRRVSTSILNATLNALKFYYGNILKRKFVYKIKRPKKDKKLPIVLSREEVFQIISSITNIKHKAIIILIYSSSLRVSEVIKLKIEDIDTQRKLIHVRNAKGRKDRYTILLDVAIETLNLYMEFYHPEKWLFPSKKEGKHITIRTVQRIFENAVKKMRINKKVSAHSLRHSFATHLLDNGIDLRYIQEILGHKSSKTTEIYTHVSNKDLSRILKPLDLIYRNTYTTKREVRN